MRHFAQLQIKKLRESRSPILLRKARTLMVTVLTVLTIPVVLVVRALRPFVVIRFGGLIGERIGHFAANTEVYLCEREAGMHGQRTLDIFYNIKPICNHQLRKMWNRTLHISRIASLLNKANRWLPGGKKHVILWRHNEDRDIHGLLASTQAHLSFTAEEESLGHKALRQLGIPEGVPFICFYSRDSAYLDAKFPHKYWTYHDYRDSSIHNYIPAAEELVRRGYYMIRMGAVVKEALRIKNPRIIDYAVSNRTEFLDIFLSAKCRFFISSATGLAAIPMIFRRPIAWVNFIPLGHAPTWGPNDLFIPKKLWFQEEHRLLTFREILDSGIGRFKESEKYKKLGIEVIENTSEEIKALAVEMDDRLNGKWQTTKEDEELQQRFWSLFKPSELNQVFLSRIGAEFLRQNQELL